VNFSTLDDKALIRFIAQNQAKALGELYDRYSRLVYSLAFNMVSNTAFAEEITQEVFIQIWEKADTYRPEKAKVSTWLTSITRYKSIDLLRKQDVRPEGHSIGWSDVVPSAVPRVDGRNPEEVTEHTFEAQRVIQALKKLPAEQKQVLTLAYFQGFTHREISDYLETPLGTVKTRIRLGMQKLRRYLIGEMAIK